MKIWRKESGERERERGVQGGFGGRKLKSVTATDKKVNTTGKLWEIKRIVCTLLRERKGMREGVGS